MAAEYKETRIINAPLMAPVEKLRMYSMYEKKTSFIYERPSGYGCEFKFETSSSMSSWGEDIRIFLLPLNEVQTQITVYSECSMPTQIFDNGKNKKNVLNIFNYLMT